VRLLDEHGQPLVERQRGRIVVSGQVQIVVDAFDQVDGGRPSRRLGLYRLGYQLLGTDGVPAPGFTRPLETLRFDRLAPDPSAALLAYAAGSGIPFYGTRRTRFLYNVTNTVLDGTARTGLWDTTAQQPGDYVLRILAADIVGNEALANRDVPITIARP
jgi:hypothetical protein